MGFESTHGMETKEFCGAARPSKELKRKERNSYCPLNAPKAVAICFAVRTDQTDASACIEEGAPRLIISRNDDTHTGDKTWAL
jgi:hypothetical protein